jgi:hypothetical protein
MNIALWHHSEQRKAQTIPEDGMHDYVLYSFNTIIATCNSSEGNC